MQINDMLNTYSGNKSVNTPQTADTSNVGQTVRAAVNSLSNLPVGSVFEGSINSIKDGVVTLGLSNGQTVNARLDSDITLVQGESIFFEVKANSSGQIAIRPYTGNIMGNPMLENALESAGLTVNGKNLTMVYSMMNESMSIDKNSLQQMASTIANLPDTQVATAVSMQKLGIPVNETNIAQFINYSADKFEITNQLNSLIENLPKAFESGNMSMEEMVNLSKGMLDIFYPDEVVAGAAEQNPEGMQAAVVEGEIGVLTETTVENLPQSVSETVSGSASESASGGVSENVSGSTLEGATTGMTDTIKETGNEKVVITDMSDEIASAGQKESMTSVGNAGDSVNDKISAALNAIQNANTESVVEEQALNADNLAGKNDARAIDESGNTNSTNAANSTGTSELTLEDKAAIGRMLTEITGKDFTSGKNDASLMTSDRLMSEIKNAFESDASIEKLAKLVSGKEFRKLFAETLDKSWTVKPEELKEKDKVGELYNRMDKQLGKLEELLADKSPVTKEMNQMVQETRANISFMNDVNQAYSFVQIPLKMSGQNVNSELYVMTNKKNLMNPENEVTAYLHLDMEHLGSTDVFIKMLKKNVTTNFYLEDDKSYDLIEKNLPLLQDRLESLGYNTIINIKNDKKDISFVDDFLKNEEGTSSTRVHRYSFDVRA
ncbi:MAG: flagellar hook-length control protein FliK [Lachnospiraceae bacterium]|nr:flagellar hook-length control protein FliK [Lachnospiraceae bacterium]